MPDQEKRRSRRRKRRKRWWWRRRPNRKIKMMILLTRKKRIEVGSILRSTTLIPIPFMCSKFNFLLARSVAHREVENEKDGKEKK